MSDQQNKKNFLQSFVNQQLTNKMKRITNILVKPLVKPYNILQKFKTQHPKKFYVFLTMATLTTLSGFMFMKYQNSLLYYPDMPYKRFNASNPKPLRHPQFRNIKSNNIQIKITDNVTLRGWHMKKQKADKLFVYFQGNAGNMGLRLPFFQQFMNKVNSEILVIGYRGYSDSDGTPSQKGLQQDSQAILVKAVEIAKERNLKLYVFGQSIGGAVAIYSAGFQKTRDDISGVILQNTFTSTNDVIVSLIPILKPLSFLIRLLNRNPWNSISIIKNVRCPILFIKSLRDQLVAPIMTDQLQQECNKHHIQNFVLEVPKGDHNNVYGVDPSNYFSQINNFLNRPRL